MFDVVVVVVYVVGVDFDVVDAVVVFVVVDY